LTLLKTVEDEKLDGLCKTRDDSGMPALQIYGIDFTSAPSARKPLTCASAILEEAHLVVQGMATWTDFRELEKFLSSPGPWTCGLDFPFAMPQTFLEEVGWPLNWEAATRQLAVFRRGTSRETAHGAFRDFIRKYRDRQPPGKKHPKRRCDDLAGAVSPLMVYGVPVGLMLLEGAPRLLASEASLVPNRPRVDDRVVVEVYPGVAGRTLLGERVPYKTEHRDTRKWQARRLALLEALGGLPGYSRYNLEIGLTAEVRDACLADPRGDRLDAVLCAVQAGWAAGQLLAGWQLPEGASKNEGWIFDPALEDSGDVRY
jgi:hypothetical protein